VEQDQTRGTPCPSFPKFPHPLLFTLPKHALTFITRPTPTEDGTEYQNMVKVPSEVPVGEDLGVGSLIPITHPSQTIRTVTDFQAANK
jgi:hypothetical protein